MATNCQKRNTTDKGMTKKVSKELEVCHFLAGNFICKIVRGDPGHSTPYHGVTLHSISSLLTLMAFLYLSAMSHLNDILMVRHTVDETPSCLLISFDHGNRALLLVCPDKIME